MLKNIKFLNLNQNILQMYSLISLFLLIFLNNSIFVTTQSSEPNSILLTNDWQKVDNGWPVQDIEDKVNGLKTQFYYITDSPTLEWTLNKTLIDSIEAQIVRLKFKYFTHYNNLSPRPIVYIGSIVEKIFETYEGEKYRNKWMPCEYVLFHQNLSEFKISISGVNDEKESIAAFKDFKIEYEVQSEGRAESLTLKTQNSNKLTNSGKPLINGWNRYKSPPNIPAGETTDFIYFSGDFQSNSSLKIDANELELNNTLINLSFKYWIEGSETYISFLNLSLDETINWVEFNENLTINNFDDIAITVTTIRDENSFVAIRDLEIQLFLENENPVKGCIEEKTCVWTINGSHVWTKENKLLKQNVIYYYPNSEINSYTIFINDNITESDVCLSFEFWTSNDTDVVIDLNYNVKDGESNDRILSVRPAKNHLEGNNVCLRDLIALNAEQFSIGFTAQQYTYENGINRFLFAINNDNNTDITDWDFNNELQTFLSQWNSNNGNEWVQEWEQISPENQVFKNTSDSMHFKAETSSQIASSAYLSSKWIKYDPELHTILPKFSVSVNDPIQWSGFRIRPRICDWLSHCMDVQLIVKNTYNSGLNKSYEFNFVGLKNSKYIKLVFYVEYFKPPNVNSDIIDIEFDLQLLHFGDPCFQSNECVINNAVCNSDPKKSVPNLLLCDCNYPNITGPLCQQTNYCYENETTSKCQSLECENLSNNYRCICKLDNTIIWNGSECNKLNEPELEKWELKENQTEQYIPTNITHNSLLYTFTNLNTTAYDVCIEIVYETKEIVNLEVNYKFGTDFKEGYNLFETSLSDKLQSLDFCVRDFAFKVEENFKIQLKLMGAQELDQIDFTLKGFNPRLKDIDNQSVKYINGWDFPDNSLTYPAHQQYWNYIQNDFVKNENTSEALDFTFNANITSQTLSKALLISDWIEYNKNFNQSENYFALKYTKDTFEKYFWLNIKIIYYENNEQIVNETKFANNNPIEENGLILSRNNPIIIPDIESPFKIIFELQYSLGENENQSKQLIVKFEDLSIGDPCLKYESNENVCGKGICQGFGPQIYQCDCEGTDSGGSNCQYTDVCSELNNDNNNTTNKEFCQSLPSDPLSKSNKCVVLSNTTFECMCQTNEYFWSSTDHRCVRNGFVEYSSGCVGTDCPLFESLVTESHLSNINMPTVVDVNDPILPFYYSDINEGKLMLQINNMNNSVDACFKFNYYVTQNSNLLISYKDLGALALTQTVEKGNSVWFPTVNSDHLCVRNLAKDIDSDFNITFNSRTNDPNLDVIALRLNSETPDKGFVEFKTRDESLISEYPYLTHWSQSNSDPNYSGVNQWPLRFPSENWDLRNDDTIRFSVLKDSVPQRSYLLSNWLISNNTVVYKLRFKLIVENPDIFDITVLAFDSDMNSTIVEKLDPNKVQNLVEIPDVGQYFRVGFIVETLVQTNGGLRLESIDLSDPCISDNTLINNCSERGYCVREGVNDYQCNCTSDQFFGKNCERIDYCYYAHEFPNGNTTGEEYCKTELNKTCVTFNGRFGCNCTEGEFWNYNSYNCSSPPKCVNTNCDLESEECKEPDPGQEEASCECRQGFVREDNSCVKYDPCNGFHRNETNAGADCVDPSAQCRTFGPNPDDYMCVCPVGFRTIRGNGFINQTKCEQIFCLFPELNDCTQFCNNSDNNAINDNNYECSCGPLYNITEENKCELIADNGCDCGSDPLVFCGAMSNQSCQCKLGYNAVKGDDDSYHCTPDLSFDATNVCPYGKVISTNDSNNNSKIACDCGEDFILNPNTYLCELKQICGSDGSARSVCDSRNAICITNTTNFGQYECICTENQQFDRNGKCVDVCEFGFRNTYCSEINAECNPLKAKLNISEIVIKSEFCDCIAGYVWSEDGSQCVIGIFTAQFSLTLKNNFIYENTVSDPDKGLFDELFYFDSNGFADELMSQNEENDKHLNESFHALNTYYLNEFLSEELFPILKTAEVIIAENQIIINDCKLENNNYKCLINVYLTKPINDESYADLGQTLDDLCIRASNLTDECFFVRNNSFKSITSSSQEFSLVVNSNDLSNVVLEKYQNCMTGTRNCYKYDFTTCTESQSEDNSLFSCLCNNEYFETLGQNDLPVQELPDIVDIKKPIYEKCGVKDLCKTNCTTENGKCTQSLPEWEESNSGWISQFHCQCIDEYKFNDTECIGVCVGVECNHGKCSPKGSNGFACDCDHGWGGEYCNNEFGRQLGGYIAAVSVLAVLVIFVIIVSFICIKKARKTGLSLNSSQNQLNDYSNTTYRTQTGYNQGYVNQGNVNQGFGRE